MAIWFTSDTHFNHANIIEYSRRPFVSLEEMTETMISRWNSCIKRGDTVYHLGDFALSWGARHAQTIDSLLSRLNGQKFLIVGNHDRKEVLENSRWQSVDYYRELKVDLGGVHKQRIVLCHYAIRVWNQMHRGAWMLHGHSHGSLTDIGGKILDMGVDCHDFCPVPLERVQHLMEHREFVALDHHNDEET
jgi:calcineurin-like phosphoesterase family protein